jgi:hypothetical protein
MGSCRGGWWSSDSHFTDERFVTTPGEVRKAVQLARDGFGGRWTFPVAAMLLALKPRANNDQVIIEGFEAEFSGKVKLSIVEDANENRG